MRHRRIHAVGAIAAAAVIVLAGCSTSEESGGEKDQLTLGTTADINGWSPTVQAPFQIWPIEAVYDRVVKCDVNGELTPAIATSWEISDDKRSFTAKLREGNTFSDGTPVDAAAIQANFEPLMDVSSDRYGDLTFDKPDDLTITITWPTPQPLMNLRMCNPWIGSAEYLSSGDLDTAPVGSGPYVLDTAGTTNGSIYAFTRNPDYYDAESYPYDKVQVRVLADDAASLNALRTGQIDGTLIQPSGYEAATDAGLEVMSSTSGVVQFVLADRLGESIPALGDVRVRQALNMAFDKKAIAESLYDGLATPVDQVFRDGSAAYIEDLENPYPYDLEKAKALMAEAGYADGFTLTIPTLEGQSWLAMVPYVTQQLAELNITLEQKALTGPNAITELLSGDFPAPLFDLTTSANSVETISIGIEPSGYWNVLHQPDATIDRLWPIIVNGTEEESAAAQAEVGRYVVDQAWFVPLVSVQNLYAHSDAVTIPESSDLNGFAPNLIDFK